MIYLAETGWERRRGPFIVASMVLGMVTDAYLVSEGSITWGYNASTSAFITSDSGLAVIMIVVMILVDAYQIIQIKEEI
jgi:hypothetical protein